MLSAEENEKLTRVGRGTPMGEYFRRFWLPLFIDEELTPGGSPVRTRILGEDLVAFRDPSGNVGVVDAFCPHRGVSMYFGRNEAGGLRCVYHGRKFDCEGSCVDYPSAPPDSKLKERGGTKAYPTWEDSGLIWIYMGPPDLMPAHPQYRFTRTPREELFLTKYLVESNWLQNLEGDMDLEHLSYLHSGKLKEGDFTDIVRSDGITTDRFAESQELHTDSGMVAAFRWRKSDGEYYWRANQHLLPSAMMIPLPIESIGETSFWIPVDDNHCWRVLVWSERAMPMVPGPTGELVRLEFLQEIEQTTFQFDDGVIVDAPVSIYRKDNGYGLDRQRQATESFTGLPNLLTEDQALTESMGHILDRTRENLDATDRGLISMRRRLLVALDEFQQGVEPMQPHHPEVFDVIPLDVDSPIDNLPELLDAHAPGEEAKV